MLVLRRRAGDSLLIGGDVEVEILEITPTRVKLGILAPDSVTIVRKEVPSHASRTSRPRRRSIRRRSPG